MCGKSKGSLTTIEYGDIDFKTKIGYFGGSIRLGSCVYDSNDDAYGLNRKGMKDLLMTLEKEELVELMLKIADNGYES